MRSYPLSHEEILELQTRLRDRGAPDRGKLADQMRQGMNRLHLFQAVQPDYVGIWPRYDLHNLLHRRGASPMPETAFYFLLGTIMRQS